MRQKFKEWRQNRKEGRTAGEGSAEEETKAKRAIYGGGGGGGATLGGGGGDLITIAWIIIAIFGFIMLLALL